MKIHLILTLIIVLTLQTPSDELTTALEGLVAERKLKGMQLQVSKDK